MDARNLRFRCADLCFYLLIRIYSLVFACLRFFRGYRVSSLRSEFQKSVFLPNGDGQEYNSLEMSRFFHGFT